MVDLGVSGETGASHVQGQLGDASPVAPSAEHAHVNNSLEAAAQRVEHSAPPVEQSAVNKWLQSGDSFNIARDNSENNAASSHNNFEHCKTCGKMKSVLASCPWCVGVGKEHPQAGGVSIHVSSDKRTHDVSYVRNVEFAPSPQSHDVQAFVGTPHFGSEEGRALGSHVISESRVHDGNTHVSSDNRAHGTPPVSASEAQGFVLSHRNTLKAHELDSANDATSRGATQNDPPHVGASAHTFTLGAGAAHYPPSEGDLQVVGSSDLPRLLLQDLGGSETVTARRNSGGGGPPSDSSSSDSSDTDDDDDDSDEYWDADDYDYDGQWYPYENEGEHLSEVHQSYPHAQAASSKDCPHSIYAPISGSVGTPLPSAGSPQVMGGHVGSEQIGLQSTASGSMQQYAGLAGNRYSAPDGSVPMRQAALKQSVENRVLVGGSTIQVLVTTQTDAFGNVQKWEQMPDGSVRNLPPEKNQSAMAVQCALPTHFVRANSPRPTSPSVLGMSGQKKKEKGDIEILWRDQPPSDPGNAFQGGKGNVPSGSAPSNPSGANMYFTLPSRGER